MIQIEEYLPVYSQMLLNTFGTRVWFVGLQGSYARNEATETSDIDFVVILDEVTISDIQKYDAMLDALPYREQLCGFLSGKEELQHWEPSDLFQLYHDTKPLVGSLDELLPIFDKHVVQRSVKIGACNIYHGCVHNMLYDKSEDILKNLYKSAIFTIRVIHYLQTGTYIHRQTDLLHAVSFEDKKIIRSAMELKSDGKNGFDTKSEELFMWSKKQITLF